MGIREFKGFVRVVTLTGRLREGSQGELRLSFICSEQCSKYSLKDDATFPCLSSRFVC